MPTTIKKEFTSRASEEEDDYLENKLCIEILNLIADIVEKPDMDSFINLIEYIINKKNHIKEIDKYITVFIPYYKFLDGNLKEIVFWLPLILKCMVKDQFFKIEFYNQKKFEFLGSNNDNYFEELTFFFTSNELSLSVNSKYKIKNCTKYNTLEIKDESDKKYKYMFFNIINKILDEDQPVDDDFMKKIYNRYKDKKFELKNEIFYKFFKISNLFEDKNLSSVSMFLMIIYNMRAKSVQSLYKLLTKYEQKIFKLLVEFFNGNQIITKDEFIEFILSLKFYNDNLIILNLETNKKYIDKQIEKFKGAEYEEKRENLNILNTNIKKEKDYFKNINYLTQEIEQDKIVDQYDNLIKTKQLKTKWQLIKKKKKNWN